jgi:dihydroneopterin aldolase
VLDVVAVRGIRGRGYHGVLPHERRDGQPFVVDVALHLDTAPAAADDDLARTVDYGGVSSRVLSVIEGEPVNLVETLAQRVADACLADPRVQLVDVTVHKPAAPVQVPVDDVAVSIRRGRTAPDPSAGAGARVPAARAGTAADGTDTGGSDTAGSDRPAAAEDGLPVGAARGNDAASGPVAADAPARPAAAGEGDRP